MWYIADMQQLMLGLTTWHITWGTYGARLHGGERLTVDRPENQRGDQFAQRNEKLEQFEMSRMRGKKVLLEDAQRYHIENVITQLCIRGGWKLRTCAAGPEGDHVHVLCDVKKAIDPKVVRKLFKRWVGQSLDEQCSKPSGGTWWADGGSTKPIKDEHYLNNAFEYIFKQRASQHCEPGRPRPE